MVSFSCCLFGAFGHSEVWFSCHPHEELMEEGGYSESRAEPCRQTMTQSSIRHQEGAGHVYKTVLEATAAAALKAASGCDTGQHCAVEPSMRSPAITRQQQGRRSSCTCVGSRNTQKEHLLGDAQLQRLFCKEKNWTDLARF